MQIMIFNKTYGGFSIAPYQPNHNINILIKMALMYKPVNYYSLDLAKIKLSLNNKIIAILKLVEKLLLFSSYGPVSRAQDTHQSFDLLC